jgi:RNA recognition motif-containing protein
MNLFVGNLSRDVTEVELRTAFQAYGEITSLNIVKDKFNGVSKGFAFVEMATEAAGEAAIAGLHRTPMKGQSLDVTIARPKQERKGGHGGKYGGGGRRRSW